MNFMALCLGFFLFFLGFFFLSPQSEDACTTRPATGLCPGPSSIRCCPGLSGLGDVEPLHVDRDLNVDPLYETEDDTVFVDPPTQSPTPEPTPGSATGGDVDGSPNPTDPGYAGQWQTNDQLFDCYRRLWDRPVNAPAQEMAFLPFYVYDDSLGGSPAWRTQIEEDKFGWADYQGRVVKMPGDNPAYVGNVGAQLPDWPTLGYDPKVGEAVVDQWTKELERFTFRPYKFTAVSYPYVMLVPLSNYPDSGVGGNPMWQYFRDHTDWSRRLNFCPEDGSAMGSFSFFTQVRDVGGTEIRDQNGNYFNRCHAMWGHGLCGYNRLVVVDPDTQEWRLSPGSLDSYIHEIGHGYLGLAHDRCLDPTTTIHYEYGHPQAIMGLGSPAHDQPSNNMQFPVLAHSSQAYLFGYLDPSYVRVVDKPGVYKLEPWDQRLDHGGHPQHQHSAFMLQIAPEVRAPEDRPPYLLLISFNQHLAGMPEYNVAAKQLDRGAVYITYHERKQYGFQRAGTILDATVRSYLYGHKPNAYSTQAAGECSDGALMIGRQMRIDSLDLIIELVAVEKINGPNGAPVAFVGIERMTEVTKFPKNRCGDGRVSQFTGLEPNYLSMLEAEDVSDLFHVGEECDGGEGCLPELCQCAPGYVSSPNHFLQPEVLGGSDYFTRDNRCYPTCGDMMADGDEECDYQLTGECESCKCVGDFLPTHTGMCRSREDLVEQECTEGEPCPLCDRDQILKEGQCEAATQFKCNDGRLDLGDICDAQYPAQHPDGDRCSPSCLACTEGNRPRLVAIGREGSVRWAWPDNAVPGERRLSEATNAYADSSVYGYHYGALGGMEIRGCAPWNGDEHTEIEREAVLWSSIHHLGDRTDIGFWRTGTLGSAVDGFASLVASPFFIPVVVGVSLLCCCALFAVMFTVFGLRRHRHTKVSKRETRRLSRSSSRARFSRGSSRNSSQRSLYFGAPTSIPMEAMTVGHVTRSNNNVGGSRSDSRRSSRVLLNRSGGY